MEILHSKMCPGKGDYCMKNKIIKQKRYLCNIVRNLHKEFCVLHPDIPVSYSFWCRNLPFWIVRRKVTPRDTCGCTYCFNIALLVQALDRMKELGVGQVQNVYFVKCKEKNISYKPYKNTQIGHFFKCIHKNSKSEKKKSVTKTVKQKYTKHLSEVVLEFEESVFKSLKHKDRSLQEYIQISKKKLELKQNKVMIHMDFKMHAADTLIFVSDSPATQCRNKTRYYFLATKLHHLYPKINKCSWNYWESAHSKGAPDCVGGVTKRTADRLREISSDSDDDLALKSFVRRKAKVPRLHYEDVYSEDKAGLSSRISGMDLMPNNIVERRHYSDDSLDSSASHDTKNIYFLGRDKATKWKNKKPPVNVRTRSHNIVTHLPGSRGVASKLDQKRNVWFVDDEIVNLITIYTNIYITRIRDNYDRERDARLTGQIEIRALFGILYLIGVNRCSCHNILKLWDNSKGNGMECCYLTMSAHRF
nr:unnamed protein product [Callosobruchus analis]